MKARGGGVVLNNASICAVQPLWYEPIYNTTKAALMMFSKTLATEVIKDNIRVNCINPGLIQTPDWVKTAKQLTADSGGDWQGYLQGVADEHATIRRFASAEELANFFVFLCSERASYSVGSTYFVDGGMLKTVDRASPSRAGVPLRLAKANRPLPRGWVTTGGRRECWCPGKPSSCRRDGRQSPRGRRNACAGAGTGATARASA